MSKKGQSYKPLETTFAYTFETMPASEVKKIRKELSKSLGEETSPINSEVHYDYIYQILGKDGKVIFGVKEDNTTFIADEFKNDAAIKFLEETYRYQTRISNKDVNVDILKTRLTKTLFFLEKISDLIKDESVKDEIANFRASLEAACF